MLAGIGTNPGGTNDAPPGIGRSLLTTNQTLVGSSIECADLSNPAGVGESDATSVGTPEADGVPVRMQRVALVG
jgi:hypothetical protein